jgi:hypothetical protein
MESIPEDGAVPPAAGLSVEVSAGRSANGRGGGASQPSRKRKWGFSSLS